MDGKSLPISMPLFRPGTSTKSVYKTHESSHCTYETVECSSNNLSSRHFDPSLNKIRSSSGSGYFDFFATEPRFSDKCKEISIHDYSKNTIFGSRNKLYFKSFSLPQEKVEKIISQCQSIVSTNQVSLRELTSLIGRLTSSVIAVLPVPLQYR